MYSVHLYLVFRLPFTLVVFVVAERELVRSKLLSDFIFTTSMVKSNLHPFVIMLFGTDLPRSAHAGSTYLLGIALRRK